MGGAAEEGRTPPSAPGMEVDSLGRIGQKFLIRCPLKEPDDADNRRGYEARQERFEKLIHDVVREEWGIPKDD